MKGKAGLAGLALVLLLAVSLTTLWLNQSGVRTAVVLAEQLTAVYNLSWFTIDGGGATPGDSPGYSLSGTIGQADAGLLSNGGHALHGGFWAGVSPPGLAHRVYLPLIIRNQ